MELTTEQLQELINTAITQAKTEILSEVDAKNQGVAANINRKLKSFESPIVEAQLRRDEAPQETETTLTLKSLQDQVKSLQADLKAKDEQTFKAERNAKISELIAKSDVNAKGILSRQIETLYGDKLVRENGKWFVQDNENVTDFEATFNDYLSTDEGSFFVKPSTTKGSGSISNNKSEKIINPPSTNIDDLLVSAFDTF